MELLSLEYMGGWTHVHMFYPCPLAQGFWRWATNVMCMLRHDPTKQGMWWTFLKDECLLDIEVIGSFKTFKFI